MIYGIRTAFLRRFAVVLTILAFIVCIGPFHLILAVLGWVEDELDVNLRDVWDGTPSTKETK